MSHPRCCTIFKTPNFISTNMLIEVQTLLNFFKQNNAYYGLVSNFVS
jgi:hypothetical protein